MQALMTFQLITCWINWRRFLKKAMSCPRKLIAFFNVFIRKDKVYLKKPHADVNSKKKKNFCQETERKIDNSYMTESHPGMKKLHLDRKENTTFATNLMKVIKNWNDDLGNLSFIEE